MNPYFTFEQEYQEIVEENYQSKDREIEVVEMRQQDERVEEYNN